MSRKGQRDKGTKGQRQRSNRIRPLRRYCKHPVPLSLCPFVPLVLTGCSALFTGDFLEYDPDSQRLHQIETIDLAGQSRYEPVTIEEATEELAESILEIPEPPELMALSVEEVRAVALANNLDLEVELFNPVVSRTFVNEEEAKFESTLTGSIRHSVTDSPAALGTEGSRADFTSADLGVRIPLRTGGVVNVDLPISRTETNNPFSLLNPAHTADLRFSISQPLLQGAGFRVNTHSIRVAKHQHHITTARTKLEAIRILAAADRAYWNLYAAQRELEVRQQQYELAMSQLERAERRVEAGDVPEIEILRAESGVAQRLEAIIIAQTVLRRERRDLKRIVNMDALPLGSQTAILLTTDPSPVGLRLDPEELSAYAIENRMEMLELELQLAIDASTVDFQRNSKLPLVTVDYTYNINGLGDTFKNAFDQLPDRSFEDWSIGLNADIPLGNEAAEARYHRAVLERVQRLATREQRRLAIMQEVFDAVDLLDQAWQRILAARQDALLAGRTFEAEQRQFEVGARTSTDVLDAAARLAEAQSSEIRALADYQIAKVDLAFATGTLLGYDSIWWDGV